MGSLGTWEGQPLLEVFSVRFNGGASPAGTISVFDGKRGQIIYSRDKPSYCDGEVDQIVFNGKVGLLPLTGPCRAINADGCVSIELDLHPPLRRPSPRPRVIQKIVIDAHAEDTRYDEAMTCAVSSTSGGHAEVTYALLSDAAAAFVEVRLLGRSAVIGGTVVAHTDVGEAVLFDEDPGDGVGEGRVVPLARSVVAVPVTSLLTIVVDLLVGGGDDGEVVKESVAAMVGTEEVCCWPIDGEGVLEVNVTWLD